MKICDENKYLIIYQSNIGPMAAFVLASSVKEVRGICDNVNFMKNGYRIISYNSIGTIMK